MGAASGPRPSPCLRTLLRFPVLLYRIGLGRLLGQRFLLLEHRGRRSGRLRRVVVEVVRRDRERDAWVVAAAWGERTQWYRNLLARPEATIQVGGRRLRVRARPLRAAETEAALLDYARRNPASLHGIARFLGTTWDGSDEGVRALGARLRLMEMVATTPWPPSPGTSVTRVTLPPNAGSDTGRHCLGRASGASP
jgi:deazaflavin-dependent oxidoreductase (nitroreductase family)